MSDSPASASHLPASVPSSSVPAVPSPAPPSGVPAAPSSKLLPVLAGAFALAGAVLAIVLPGFAWLFCATAIVIAIVALAKRRLPRWPAIAALIVAPFAWLIAIFVVLANFAAGLDSVW